MKKIMSFIVLLCMSANLALADCDFRTDITKLPDGGFRYSEACHLQVGKLVQSNSTKDAQIADLTKAITLKDLALQTSDKRTQLWMDTSSQMEARLQKIDSMENTNKWLYFGLGAFTMIGSAYVASQLIKR